MIYRQPEAYGIQGVQCRQENFQEEVRHYILLVSEGSNLDFGRFYGQN